MPFWLIVLSLAAGPGCRAVAPIHVWSPPTITSAVGKKVAIARLAGPQPVAEQIQSHLLQSVPRDQGRFIEAIAAEELRSRQPVRLASAGGDMPSDLALLPIARREGIDFLLMGEVLAERSRRANRSAETVALRGGAASGESIDAEPRADSAKEAEASLATLDQERLSVAWRIYDVAEARPLADRVIVTDQGSMEGATESPQPMIDRRAVFLAEASARDVWRLLSPSVQRRQIPLAVPWLLPGSKAVRQGNTLAIDGRWPEAERLWRRTLEQHPYQHAARNNLAIAAAARQDFSTARRLIREAVRQRSKTLYQENLAWIEMRQRDYHTAFGLADPPEGWLITASSPQTP